MIYLYLKTHNVTGLKYLGQTKSKDPYKYKGSGTRWRHHIKKHGYDVTTQILLITESKEDLIETGIFFSRLFGVVKSKEWANIKEETGEGGFDKIYGENQANNFINGIISKGQWWFTTDGLKHRSRMGIESRKSLYPKSAFHEKNHTTESKRKIGLANSISQLGDKNSQFGKMWITNGIESTRIMKEDTIPEGWCKGRKM